MRAAENLGRFKLARLGPKARQHDVGSLIVEVLDFRRGRSPLILGDLDTSPASTSHSARRAHPTLIGEEPVNQMCLSHRCARLLKGNALVARRARSLLARSTVGLGEACGKLAWLLDAK